MEHWLITLNDSRGRIHAYLMTEDRADIEKVADRMTEIAESAAPLLLATKLPTDLVSKVRKILIEGHPETKPHLDRATDFHCSIFAVPTNGPEEQFLMKVH